MTLDKKKLTLTLVEQCCHALKWSIWHVVTTSVTPIRENRYSNLL